MAEKEMGKLKTFCARLVWKCKGLVLSILFGVFLWGSILLFGLAMLGSVILTFPAVASLCVWTLIVSAEVWTKNLPEYKFEEAIKEAEKFSSEEDLPPEVSAKVNLLIDRAKDAGEMGELNKWVENYKSLIGLQYQVEVTKKLVRELPNLKDKINLLEKDLGLWAG